MANQEHLAILKQGIEVWNTWRREQTNVNPDLSWTNLSKADFSCANLSKTDFCGTDLSGADLRGAIINANDLGWTNLEEDEASELVYLDGLDQAYIIWEPPRRKDLRGKDLRWTNLSGIDLSRADLSEANLSWAFLSRTDLREAILREADLSWANLSWANLSKADLRRANLFGTNLSRSNLNGVDLSFRDLSKTILIGVDFSRMDLSGTNLTGTNLSSANLSGVNLSKKDLSKSNLSGANLSGANLNGARLVETNLTKAILTNCWIYGISVWNVRLDEAIQFDLKITLPEEQIITVDNLKIAQFIYLLLNNAEIREVIDTITSKVVLILGRFSSERRVILDAIREELRKRNYTPVLFDFEKPASRDITETVSTLAHMARFVIADLSDAKSIPQELKTIVPNLPSVPVQPILLSSQREYGMFEHFTRFPWVLPIYHYADEASLLQTLKENIIEPAEQKAKELTQQ